MKKNTIKKTVAAFVLVVASLFLNFQEENKKQLEAVSLGVCVDGDTVRLKVNGQEKKYRLLFIDTPESTKQVEPYGIEAAKFTCEQLSNAKTIEIQYQEGNDKQDQYGRDLVWIFVDGELLQTKIAKAGYLKKTYDNGGPFDYKEEILEADKWAKSKKIGLYEKN